MASRKKAGFRQEGILRNNAVKDSRVRNMALYSLLREECPPTLAGE